MLKIRYWIKDFFGFPRSQVNGFLVLLILLILLLFSEPVWHWWVSRRPRDITADRAMLDSLVSHWRREIAVDTLLLRSEKTFYFNPNNISEDQFVALGFSRHMAARFVRYRSKGGTFRVKSDLLKIYGMDTLFYHRIYSFITLPETRALPAKKPEKRRYKTTEIIREERIKLDLNKADTSALKEIYGIGEKLSLRILRYRDVLGGFVSMDQLQEVYGLDTLVVKRLKEQFFIANDFEPAKIDLNRASEKQLAIHPYLNKKARAIVSYRFQHGDFKSVEDIRKVVNLDEKFFQKVALYVEVK
jgi:competence protein ComEA